MKERLHWLALHGFIRGAAAIGRRRGDMQARLISDPAVAADPVPFCDELHARGPMVKSRVGYLAVDHSVVHSVLRSEDFRVLMLGSNLPAPVRWVERRTREDLLHPLREPSLLATEPPEHTRYRKTVSGVSTARAVAALRDRVEHRGGAAGRAGRRVGRGGYRREVLLTASGRHHQRHPGCTRT